MSDEFDYFRQSWDVLIEAAAKILNGLRISYSALIDAGVDPDQAKLFLQEIFNHYTDY